MTQTLARLTLGIFLLATIILALYQHGKPIPRHSFHAGLICGSATLEALLIWLAGGWG